MSARGGHGRIRTRDSRRRAAIPAILVSVAIALVAVAAFALVAALGEQPPGGVFIEGTASLVNYHQTVGQHAFSAKGVHFTIGGDATSTLYPATTSTVDLTFTNKSDQSITLPARAITIRIHSPRSGCPAAPNFSVVQTLTSAVTIPKGATAASLSTLGIAPNDWPVIEMATTGVAQNACAGMTITLRYSTGHGNDAD